MVCEICFHPNHKPRFITSRLSICQWCITELVNSELYPNEVFSNQFTTPNLRAPKENRLLRALNHGLINGTCKQLQRPEDEEYYALKSLIHQQDQNKCLLCKRDKSKVGELHLHHIIPLSKFGTNCEKNLVTLCHSCHNKQHPEIKVTRHNPILRSPKQQRFIAVDIETTGFSNEDSIIEIGAALYVNGLLSDVFQTLVYTKRQLPIMVTQITGITPEMLLSAPKANFAFPAFRKFIGDSRLVFHHAVFDMRFLNRYAEFFKCPIENKIHDTLKIARMKLPMLPDHKLVTLIEHFQLNVKPTHRAKEDSIATGALYLKLSSLKSPAKSRKRTKKRSCHIQQT